MHIILWAWGPFIFLIRFLDVVKKARMIFHSFILCYARAFVIHNHCIEKRVTRSVCKRLESSQRQPTRDREVKRLKRKKKQQLVERCSSSYMHKKKDFCAIVKLVQGIELPVTWDAKRNTMLYTHRCVMSLLEPQRLSILVFQLCNCYRS